MTDSNNTSDRKYDSGADFWRDNVMRYDADEAAIICKNYINVNLKCEHSDDERDFCREVFAAMYEATANKVNPTKLVYPYDFKTAGDRMETSYFTKNRELNYECTRAIDEAISASHYSEYHYNLELAAMSVIGEHGFERVNAVIAHQLQKHRFDGRYSEENKDWARDFVIYDESYSFMDSHACLIDDFARYARKLYTDFEADQFALPGCEEHGEDVHGYGIIRSIMIDENQGYAIGYNPDAVNPFVFWQFYVRDDRRSYNWGIYGEEIDAVNAYNARLFAAFN